MRPSTLAALLISACLLGCGGDEEGAGTELRPGDPFGNHDAENVTVLGAPTRSASGGSSQAPDAPDAPVGEAPVLVGTPEGGPDGAEICVSDTLCEVVDASDTDWCERAGGPADLIYVDGELVETICYPPAEDPERPLEVVDAAGGDIDVVQNANRTTVVFDEGTNGTPIEGDIAVDGNNVAIYGNGPDNTIVDGNVVLDGNNARLRGVTITGDLILMKNTVAVVLCRILGNVRLETTSTNNSVFAENDIYGDFTSGSNGNLFVGNAVEGNWEHTGNGNACDRNHAFGDENDDDVIDAEERGGLLECP